MDMENFVMKHGWGCPCCTVQNQPFLSTCPLCSTKKPANYQLPVKKKLTASELKIFTGLENEHVTKIKNQALENSRLFEFDRNNLYIPNYETFECPLCDEDTAPGDGVILRSCTHMFCRPCIEGVIRNSTRPVVLCPALSANDRIHPCNVPLQHREIQGILNNENEYKRHLQRVMNASEGSLTGQRIQTFHCLTSNCDGWVIYENEGNKFVCAMCKTENCIPCKGQHSPLSCSDYKRELKRKDHMDKNQDYVKSLISEGEGMRCPGCQTLIVKNGGCFFVKCKECQMEICWGKKGPRWGPGGRYDESGGCKCDYKTYKTKCVPNCPGCTYPG